MEHDAKKGSAENNFAFNLKRLLFSRIIALFCAVLWYSEKYT